MTTEYVDAPCVTANSARPHPIHLSYSRAKSAAAFGRRHGDRRVSALARRVLFPSASRGGGAPSGARYQARLAGRPRRRARPLALGEGDAAPFGAPHGVGRPARSRSRLTARFQLGAGRGRQPVVTDHVGSLCPRADPRAARAPCLQGTKAQAPHPAPPQMPPVAPSNEWGYGNIYLGNIIL
jgi:hypothetical protein